MDSLEYRFQFRQSFCRTISFLNGFLSHLHFFRTSHICRIFSGQSKFCQSQRVGTIGRGLTGRNQLVCSSYRIMNLRYHFQNQVICQCRHFRPVFDIGTKLDFNRWICHTLAVKHTIFINCFIKVIFWIRINSFKFCCRSQAAFVGCCGSNRTCIHKCNRRNLSILNLGTFTVREVSGRMTNTEGIVGRSISGTKTRSAECCLHDCSCSDQGSQCSVLSQLHVNRSTCRIYTQSKCTIANTCTFQNVCSRTDIFKSTAGASCDDSLVHIQFPVMYFIFQCKINLSIQTYLCLFLYIIQNIHQVCIQFIDGVGITRMERHSDHWTDLVQFNHDHTVIISSCTRIQLFIFFTSSMSSIEFFNLLICSPDRRQAGSFCGHNIHTDTEVSTQIGYSRSHKFHYFILNETIFEHSSDNSQSHVLRSYTWNRCSCHVYSHHTRHIDIIGFRQQLFYQLRPAFTHSHSTQSTIASMAVRTQNHLASASQHFSCILVDNCLMRRYINSAIFFSTGKAKHMVILVNGSSHCTKRVVAVGQHIRHRKLFQS